MGGRVECSPEVLAVIGAEVLATLRANADDYRCRGCDGPGRANHQRTNVILIVGPEGPPVVQLAHAGCAASEVLYVDRSTADSSGWSASEDVMSVPLLWPALPGGPMAGLIIDRHGQLGVVFGQGDSQDPWLGMLLESQWALLFDIGQELPVVSSAVVRLDDGGRVMLHAKDGTAVSLLEPLPDPDADWVAAALGRGMIRIYAGELGIERRPGVEVSDLLGAAVAAGRVAGAFVPVQRSGG